MNIITFDNIVKSLENATDKDGNRLKMDSLFITQNGLDFQHYFSKDSQANDLRSISKPIICMALGIAINQGLTLRGHKFTLETPIWQFFDGKISINDQSNVDQWKKVKLKHLLTHTIGHEIGLLFSKDIKDKPLDTLLDYLFNYPIKYTPGEYFVYSNAGPYVLSALIQEEVGISLAEWVSQLLFKPIGINEYIWKNYGKYCAASSGLKLSHADLHKIGRLFINNGSISEKQLVPIEWLDMMRNPQVKTPSMYDEARVFPKYAYGFYLWICKDGSYYCDGTDGQYLIVLPKSGTLITTFGHQSDMKPITECFRFLL